MARKLAPATPPSTPAQHRPAPPPLPNALQPSGRSRRKAHSRGPNGQHRPRTPPPLPAHCAKAGGTTRHRTPVTLAPGTVLPAVPPAAKPQPAPVWYVTGHAVPVRIPTPAKPGMPPHPPTQHPGYPATPAGTIRVVQRYAVAVCVGGCTWQPTHYRLWASYRNHQWVYTLATSTQGGAPGSYTRCPHTPPMQHAQAHAWLAARVGQLQATRALAQCHQ